MCGIMGWFCFAEARPNKESMTNMFSILECRGRDASGYAFIKDKRLIVNKAPVKSSELVKHKEWGALSLPRTLIAHTRLKTQGSEKLNVNNHPLYNKYGIAVVHNGMIHNDKEIFTTAKRDGQVDSEAILSVLSTKAKGDKIKRVFEKLEGSFAFASIDVNDPEKLILVKKDNPLCLYLDTKAEILYFCSEREIMQESLNIKSSSIRGFNIGEDNYHYYEMENNYGMVINRVGVENYKRYTPKRDEWMSFRNYHLPFGKSDLDMDFIECPYCLAKTLYDGSKLVNQCESCGAELNEEDIYT